MGINGLKIQEASAFKTLYSLMLDNFFISYLIILVGVYYFLTKDLEWRLLIRNWRLFDWFVMSLGMLLLITLGYMMSAFFE